MSSAEGNVLSMKSLMSGDLQKLLSEKLPLEKLPSGKLPYTLWRKIKSNQIHRMEAGESMPTAYLPEMRTWARGIIISYKESFSGVFCSFRRQSEL